MNRNKIMCQYSLLQGTYWMLFCVVYSFASVFLLSRAFSNTAIGIVVAAGNILGTVLQPSIAAIADQSKKITVHKLTALLAVIMIAVLGCQYAIKNSILITALLFIMTDAILQVMQPMVNSVSVYYMHRGTEINFGIARGIGSVSFAVISSVAGKLIASRGVESILLTGIVLLTVLLIVLLIMPVYKETAEQEEAVKEKNIQSIKFLKKYDLFYLTLLGLTLLMCSHNMLNNFSIQIIRPIGGDSAVLGKIFSIAALCELPTMFLFGFIIKKISSGKLLIISGVFFFIKAFSYLLCFNITQLYLIQILQMGAFALYIPASVYYSSELMEKEDQFKGQAFMAGTSTLGGVMGSLLGGVIIDYINVRGLIATAAVTAFIGTLMIIKSVKKERI